MDKRNYTRDDVCEALVEHVKDINHQLSLKIGNLHHREGYDNAAMLLLAKSQALSALAAVAPSRE
ncbi:hypothetical protein [Paenibacillus whitsoniae]|uniref:Uncharacterized protein n=1 Tax=Paenibacillus whitsoniae TaxID=2496558 RepID=A0A430J7I5_9BACL|nr:hypothetical protein [Paenibacillus whitsoniae]RTE05504.1 hypothetical protein EJQ19_25115 [Paenibacillus whitsoniae]